MTCVSMPSSTLSCLTCVPCKGSNTLINKCYRTRRWFISGVRMNFPLIRRAWKVPPWVCMFLPGNHHDLAPTAHKTLQSWSSRAFPLLSSSAAVPKTPIWELHLCGGGDEKPPSTLQQPGLAPLMGTSRSSQGSQLSKTDVPRVGNKTQSNRVNVY